MILDVLGLSDLQERVYRTLVTRPSENVSGLAASLRSDTAEISLALSDLEQRGLAARATGTPGHFVAAPPALALGSLITERQEDLRAAQQELTLLSEQYRGAAAERTITDVIDVVNGGQAVAQRFAQLQRGAKREVMALIRAGVAVVSSADNVEEGAAVRRGVHYTVVVDQQVLDRPGFFDEAAEALDRGEDVRVSPRVPLRLLIADRQIALVPLQQTDGGPSAGALLIHPSALLDALVTLFDITFQSARRLTVGDEGLGTAPSDEIDTRESQILSLLLAGLTDEALGSQLGLSLRTVQRCVRGLMDKARVTTRLQLGHEAARRGWA